MGTTIKVSNDMSRMATPEQAIQAEKEREILCKREGKPFISMVETAKKETIKRNEIKRNKIKNDTEKQKKENKIKILKLK
jgi:hypothetical protein